MKMRFLTIVVAALAATSCVPDWAKDNDADVLLIMTNVFGHKGGEQEDTPVLYSDVRSPGIINDNAGMILRAIPKSPGIADDVIETGLNDVILRRYTVHFYRGDGRSVQGVDVPHDISGEMTGTVPVNGELETNIVVVRHQAKQEPPLRNLARFGGEDVFTAFAEITVYGETMAKRTVKATGRLEVHFADFADEN